MTESPGHDLDRLISRIGDLTGRAPPRPPKIHTQTSDFMRIDRDDIVDLQGEMFLVRGNEREGRFGLVDEPKFWVKRALALEGGGTRILKLMFRESFQFRLGVLRIKCTRSGEKEAQVLDLVRGDPRFMQGRTLLDAQGNPVRVIEFIPGENLLGHLVSLRVPHEEYFRGEFPGILARTMECFRGIARLHEANLCHGDIRNDHIIIERGTGRFRWIDFDLTPNFSDLDVWNLGNILHCIAGQGFVTFRNVARLHPELRGRLRDEDASLIHTRRLMNLKKVYPYLPGKLNDVLLRFSVGTSSPYDTVDQIVDDLADFATSMGWDTGPPPGERLEGE